MIVPPSTHIATNGPRQPFGRARRGLRPRCAWRSTAMRPAVRPRCTRGGGSAPTVWHSAATPPP